MFPRSGRASIGETEEGAEARRRARASHQTLSASQRAAATARIHNPSDVRERVGGRGAAALPRAEGS